MDIASRSKWYLKNLLHCKDNGWIMITHEYMRDHWEQMQNEISQSLFDSWEISPFTADEIKDVEQYYLSDSLFEKMEQQCGSRTEMLYQLSSSVNEPLAHALQKVVDQIHQRHPSEKIEGMFHCLEAWKTIYAIGRKNQFPVIPYSFSAFRKPHGYRQTLYHCNLHTTLNSTKEAKERYEKYLSEGVTNIPIFSNRELVAIFGKDRTLPLIPLMKAEPKYEIGICYLQLGEYENAIKYLKKFKGKDMLVSVQALGSIGDAYMELNNMDKALSYYKKAIKLHPNELLTPRYLYRAAFVCEMQSQWKAAAQYYETLQHSYPNSLEANDVEKRIAYVKAKQDK